MSIKREAAFHEAGHAVAAHRSRFHKLVGPINLADYGSGEMYLSLSKSKCTAGGKAADASAQKDKEVAVDLAIVLSAGLVAERIAQERDSELKANPDCAIPDHELMQQQLQNAGLSKRFDRHEEAARELLESQWPLVAALAQFLFQQTSSAPDEIIAFIEKHSQ